MTKYLETKTNSIEEAIKRVVLEKKLDPVNKVAVKKKFDDRKDKDIDNDGDVDSTDKYLHKRRKAISKAISKEETELDEAKFQVNYSKGGKLFSKTISAKDEDDAEERAIKQFKIDDDPCCFWRLIHQFLLQHFIVSLKFLFLLSGQAE